MGEIRNRRANVTQTDLEMWKAELAAGRTVREVAVRHGRTRATMRRYAKDSAALGKPGPAR